MHFMVPSPVLIPQPLPPGESAIDNLLPISEKFYLTGKELSVVLKSVYNLLIPIMFLENYILFLKWS